MQHRFRPYYRPNPWLEWALGAFIIAGSAIMLISLFLFAVSYDCHWQLKLSFTTQHLCYLMGY